LGLARLRSAVFSHVKLGRADKDGEVLAILVNAAKP
jgi:hypothetical protein